MVAAEQDFSARKIFDEFQIRLAFLEIAALGVISGDDNGVCCFHFLIPIFPDLLFMIFPHGIKYFHGFIHKKAQVEISDCV